MNILFLGGDERYKYLMYNLLNSNSIYQVGFNDIDKVYTKKIDNLDLSDFDVILFPISGINDKQEIKTELGMINIPNNILANIKENTIIFTGLKTKKLLELIPKKQLISFLDFEEFEEENNTITVNRNYK